MMEKLDKRYVYLELDVFWIKQAGQDPLELLKKYPKPFCADALKGSKDWNSQYRQWPWRCGIECRARKR